MKATELRIGNYYQYAGNGGIVYTQVQAIKYNQFGLLSDFDGTNFEICKPIPLTEEWLLKFGFKHQNKYNLESNLYSKKLKSGYFTVYSKTETLDFKSKFLGWKLLSVGFDLKIESVHQLQNLYFALTGEELTL